MRFSVLSPSPFRKTVPRLVLSAAVLLVAVTAGTAAGSASRTPPPPPTLDPHDTLTAETTVSIAGSAPGASEVEVSGGESILRFPVDQDRFGAEVPLGLDRVNFLYFTSIAADGTRSAATPTRVTHDQQPPTLFIDMPSEGAELTSNVVDVAGRVGDLLSGFLGLTVTVNGTPAVVDIGIGNNGTFFAQGVSVMQAEKAGGRIGGISAVGEGPGLIIAEAIDALGNRVRRSIAVEIVAVPDDTLVLEKVSGDRQSAPVGTEVQEPIIASVKDRFGSPFPNKVVTFEVVRSDGGLSDQPGGPAQTTLQVRTDANGEALAFWRLGSDAGCGNNRVEVRSSGAFGTNLFCASGRAQAPVAIELGSGNNQRAEVSGPAPELLQVFVHDGQNGAPGVPVVFSVTEGGGLVDGEPMTTVVTDATGHASVSLVLGPSAGANRLQATFAGNTGEPVSFYAFGVQRDANQPTRVIGRIVDSALQPIQGAAVRLSIGEVSFTAESDIDGQFSLEDLPAAGFGHLFVDGTTAFHVGGPSGRAVSPRSFPVIEYALVVIQNATNSLPDVIPLPRLNPNNARDFDGSQDVELTVEGIEGLKFTVSKDTVITLPDGRVIQSGSGDSVVLSLDQVHYDRIPMAMPDGIVPRYSGTFQPGGAFFDPPVAVEMPNFFGVEPGKIVYFLSFDHETHRFEIHATGSVSADGQILKTDPGSGLMKSGWHGPNAPFGPRGTVRGGSGDPEDEDLDDPDEEPANKEDPTAAPDERDRGFECHPRQASPEDELLDPVYLFSGELYYEVEDLRIRGRGMDFIWARKYRSKLGPETAQGNGWDFSYNIGLEALGQDLLVCDGNTRRDRYRLRPDGTWANNGHFRELSQNGDGSYTLVFSNTGTWDFLPLDGSPAQGKIATIVDRNGNRIAFAYDPSGRLETITDTLDRDITLAYDANGFITTVTDFIGRQVRYTYYQNGDAGGVAGDLESCTTPAVIGTPHGNDFPAGKTTTYTYSQGFADPRLNHNLLSITDPEGQTYLQNTYAATTDPADLEFDRVMRQDWGDPGDILDIVYVPQTPAEENAFAKIKVIVNDRVGNVKELFYDARNRGVLLREYTGRAPDPDAPTTETQNRPSGKLRLGDPDFFETRHEYNADGLRTKTVHPNGNLTLSFYGLDLNPAQARLSRGNLCVRVRLPGSHLPVGDQPVLAEYFELEPQFNFLTRHVDARGSETRHEYDAQGNRIRTIHPISSIVEELEYNAFGQVTAHLWPDNGNGHRRRDELLYYDSGPQRGYLEKAIDDATQLALTTVYEHDAVGNVVRVLDPKGQDRIRIYNALDQVVREVTREVTAGSLVRYERDTFYDGCDNVVRIDVQNVDAAGQLVSGNPYLTTLFEYDVLDHPTRVCQEIGSFDVPRLPPLLDCSGLPASEFLTTETFYDANRNPILLRYGEAAEGRQPANTLRTLFDERDLPFQEIRAGGDPDQSTRQLDYDGNRNLVRLAAGLEDTPRVTLMTFDAYDRLAQATDAMGNVREIHYDAAGNLVSEVLLGELEDIDGSSGNVRLTEVTNSFDLMGRLVSEAWALFDPETGNPIGEGLSRDIFEYSDASLLLRELNDNGHARVHEYDTANRQVRTVDAAGNTVEKTYDASSNVIAITETEVSDLGGAPEVYVTTFEYDGLDRLAAIVDVVGNRRSWAYDSRNNLEIEIDALGQETRHAYDGADRLVQTVRDLDGDGADQADPQDIVTSQTWDDSLRLVSRTDGNGNTTTSSYDPLGRWNSIAHADGTAFTASWNVHDDRVQSADPNGTIITSTFDRLGRRVQSTIQPGPGVSQSTTFETFAYDGLGRMVRAQDDDSLVLRAYDSLSNVIAETLDGQTTASVFDGAGNRMKLDYPGGRSIEGSFDALERLQALADSGTTIATYAFVGPGRVTRRTYGNGVQTDYAFDGIANSPGDFGVRKLVRATHVLDPAGANLIVDDRVFAWDKSYRKIQRRDIRSDGPGITYDFVRDAVCRLVRTTATDPSVLRDEQYVFDAAGNRTSVSGGADPGAYVLDAASPPADFQVHQYTATPFEASRTYDENGNLTAIDSGLPSGRSYRYDHLDRLVEAVDVSAGQRHTYAYDPLGRRIAKIVDADGAAEETRFFYDGWQVIEEQDGAGATLATYVYGHAIDDVLTMRRGGDDHYFHHDDLLSVVALTDAAGSVVERYEYGDYGRLLDPTTLAPLTGPPSSVGSPYFFTGRRLDPELGWYFYRTRYFDPRAGRFASRDRLGLWGDSANHGNGLTYVGNDPGSRVDPMGEVAVAAPVAVAISTGQAINVGVNTYYRGRRVAQIDTRLRELDELFKCFRWDPAIADLILRERRALVGEAAGTLSDVARDLAEQTLPGHPDGFVAGPSGQAARMVKVADAPAGFDVARAAQRFLAPEQDPGAGLRWARSLPPTFRQLPQTAASFFEQRATRAGAVGPAAGARRAISSTRLPAGTIPGPPRTFFPLLAAGFPLVPASELALMEGFFDPFFSLDLVLNTQLFGW